MGQKLKAYFCTAATVKKTSKNDHHNSNAEAPNPIFHVYIVGHYEFLRTDKLIFEKNLTLKLLRTFNKTEAQNC